MSAVYTIETNLDCAICFDSLEGVKAWAHNGLGNRHPVHPECLKDWIKRQTTVSSCPSCREKLDIRSIFNLTGTDLLLVNFYKKIASFSGPQLKVISAIFIYYACRNVGNAIEYIGENSEEALSRAACLSLLMPASTYLLKPSKDLPLQEFFIQQFDSFNAWNVLGTVFTCTLFTVASHTSHGDLILRISAAVVVLLALTKKISLMVADSRPLPATHP